MADGADHWLSRGTTDESPIILPRLGPVMKKHRIARGLTQAALGELLQIDQTYVSMIERGLRPIRDMGFLLRICRLLDIPPAELGLSSEFVTAAATADDGEPGPGSGGWAQAARQVVQDTQDSWRSARRYLNHHRSDLAQAASRLYPPEVRVRGTPLIAAPSWLPAEPVDLGAIDMIWVPGSRELRVTGTEPETEPVRPLRAPGKQFERYTSAIRYLDSPALFENRPSYRLHGLAWAGGAGAMRFGLATYFDKLDISEAVGHELAAARMRIADGKVTARDLPFRSLIGDPFDFHRRAVLPAITTLTLRRRRNGTASFLLHWRDPAKVATAAGLYDVIPAGEFQPSSIAPYDLANDFGIWRNIVREFSEELLGAPEHDGSRSTPIDYDAWPFYRLLGQARAEGKLTAVCLGAGLDALTLAATILTAVVIDDDVFDEAFRDAVRINAEGITIFGERGRDTGQGLPFTGPTVTRLLEREPMASPGAACLALAWRHRFALLSSQPG
jgi:transcriptional regulator with XRE-family HTH domain